MAKHCEPPALDAAAFAKITKSLAASAATRVPIVAYRYRLTYADGEDAGEVQYPDGGVQAGDEIRIEGNRRMRVRSVIAAELAGEFVDGSVYAVLEIEPVFD